jgi:DNA-binding MarR family transcriptional regulator
MTYPMRDSIGHLVNLTHRKLQPMLERRVKAYGLSYGTWFFLRALWEKDGGTQRELAARVGASEPTTLYAVRELARRGLVMLRTDRHDRRRLDIGLTKKARDLYRVLIPSVAEINGVLLNGLRRREVSELRRMLRIIKDNTARDNFKSSKNGD